MRLNMAGIVVAATLLAAPIVTPAHAQVSVGITIAPPAPRYERVPSPRRGYVWAPGYWGYRGGRYVWIGGHYIRARPGYRWAPAVWQQRGPGWHYVPGHWVR